MTSILVTIATDAGIVEADVVAAAKNALAQIENIVVTDVLPTVEADVKALVAQVETDIGAADSAGAGTTD